MLYYLVTAMAAISASHTAHGTTHGTTHGTGVTAFVATVGWLLVLVAVVSSGNDGLDFFMDWLDFLDNLSGWGDDFADLLDDGLGDGVLQNVWVVSRVGLLERSTGAFVLRHNVHVSTIE